MEKLIKKLENLKNLENFEEIEKELCEIGSELLTKYEIRVNNITIEPLRVEPYFYKEKVFEDKFIHYEEYPNGGKYYGPKQRNRFGKLYIHKGFSGVDIVLSDSDQYAFSFLIKNSRVLIDNCVEFAFVKQYGVAEILRDNGIKNDFDDFVLYKKEKPLITPVFKTIRNGLKEIAERDDFSKEEQNCYNDLMISSFIELKEHTSCEYDFETGYGGDKAVVEYLKKYKLTHPDISKEDLNKMRKDLYPNGSKTEFEKEFGE